MMLSVRRNDRVVVVRRDDKVLLVSRNDRMLKRRTTCFVVLLEFLPFVTNRSFDAALLFPILHALLTKIQLSFRVKREIFTFPPRIHPSSNAQTTCFSFPAANLFRSWEWPREYSLIFTVNIFLIKYFYIYTYFNQSINDKSFTLGRFYR